jgi:hypothetical protein
VAGLNLEQLPAWALFAIALVWITFQFVLKIVEWAGKKRDERARREYRERRGVSFDGTSVRSDKSRPSEDTGRHDLRSVLEDEREREQRLEIVSNTRQHAEMMNRLVAAESGQTMLLTRIVETLEQQSRNQQQMAATQSEIVRYLRLATSSPGNAATLRNLDAMVVHEDGGG